MTKIKWKSYEITIIRNIYFNNAHDIKLILNSGRATTKHNNLDEYKVVGMK